MYGLGSQTEKEVAWGAQLALTIFLCAGDGLLHISTRIKRTPQATNKLEIAHSPEEIRQKKKLLTGFNP